MVAPRQVEIPFYRGISRQRGQGHRSLAQIIGRTVFPFLHNIIVSDAQRVGANFREFAVPEVADVVCGGEKFKTAAKRVGRQTLRKQLGSCSRKRSASRVIPTKSAKQTSWSRRDFFYKHISLIMSSYFWHFFCVCF